MTKRKRQPDRVTAFDDTELPWPKYYIPDPETHELREVDMWAWSEWMEMADRQVAFTGNPDKFVSTVCLGLDHGLGDGPPIVFETMVFINGKGGEMARYASWAAAEAGHKRMVEKCLLNAETRTKAEES